MNMTRHAQIRAQQRGIPALIQEWLLAYGAIKMSHGAQVRYFDKAARKRLQKEMGALVVDRLGDLLNVYLVEDEGSAVITVAHRHRRIKRN